MPCYSLEKVSVEKGKSSAELEHWSLAGVSQSGEQGGDVAEKAGRGWSRHGLRCPPRELGLAC